MNHRPLSRRDFFRLAGAASAGMLLVGCGGSGPGASSVPTTRMLLDSWGFNQGPFKDMEKRWNESHPASPVRMESSPGGWETKAVGQIRGGKLEWSAAGVCTPFMNLAAWVELGVLQPVESLIAASQIAGAKTFLSDMLPQLREDMTYKGQMYGIPYGVENITYQWRKDLFGEVGVVTDPQSWPDLTTNCSRLRDALRAKGDTKTFPLAFDLHLSRSLGALLCSISDRPYTDDGLIAWDSPEMRECLKFMRQCSRTGLTPPNCGVGTDVVDMWLRGRVGSLYSTSSRGVFAQNSLGMDKVITSPIPTVDGKPHSGSAFWGDAVTILNSAPRAQEAVDYFIWAFGPQNTDWQKGAAKAGLAPAFSSAYTGVLDKDPDMAPYRWMTHVRDRVAVSLPAPKNYMYAIQVEAWGRWHPDYLKDNSTMTEDELIRNVLKTTQEMHATVLTSVPRQ